MKGTIVGSYRILDTLSVGGMGTVYRAEHTLLGRLAAVKILHPEMCTKRDIVNRFFNEARTTSSIKHPGIVEVLDFGYMQSGHAYLVMEFLEGRTLTHRVRSRGRIPEGEAAVLLRSVCVALSAAHDKGVVHRDLKPDNIFVLPDPDSALGERIKILDFGIAKLTDIGPAGSATKTGAVMGTPTYMSPEQCRGTGDVDHRADLYSIGCMFYEMVAGRPPFVRSGAGELIGSHLFLDPEPPSRHVAGLSPETEALIMSLLAKQPDRRVQSAKELAQRLAAIAKQHGWMTLGEVSRPSLAHAAASAPGAPSDATTTMVPTTPQLTPPSLIVTTATPSGEPATPEPETEPEPPQKPTTLSGAASQISVVRRSRRGLWIAIAGGLVAAAAGIAAIIAFGSASSPATRSAAAPPATTASPTAAPPAAVPAVVTPTVPAAAVPPATETPPPVIELTVQPPSAEPSPPPAATAATVSTEHTEGTKPTETAPAIRKPPAKPARKPARRPDKAGSASEPKESKEPKEPKELLEQDI